MQSSKLLFFGRSIMTPASNVSTSYRCFNSGLEASSVFNSLRKDDYVQAELALYF